VLTGFASISSMMQVAERFPFVKDEVIKTQPDVTPYYEWDDTEAIYEIILYRLKALSSPKAFFTGEEAMLSVGKEPMINSTMLPWTTFYIPNYSESTNRDYILNVVGYGSAMNSTVIEDEFSELFSFCNKNGATVFFKSKNYEQSTKIYPTVELDNKTYPYFSIMLPELNNALLEHREDDKIYIDGEYLCGGMANGCANLVLNDITGDGVPELCFVMATGSGMIDYNIVIIDYQTKECIFTLSDRSHHDYKLFFRDGLLCVLERKYMSVELTRTGVLTYDGSKISVSWDAEVNYPYDLPSGIPFDPVYKPETSEPPVDTSKNDKDEVKISSIKLVEETNLCIVTANDGKTVAEGSYSCVGDTYILCFDGGFQYVFDCKEDTRYVYYEDDSNAIPAYDLEDGTVFNLIDGYILEIAEK